MDSRDLDGQVVRDDSPLNDILDRFVCARQPRMRGIDLDQFQFDFDLTMAIFFVAPDGTVLGRFCASGADRARFNTLPALRKAAERALQLFENLDENREALAGKKRKSPVSRVEDLPHSDIRDEAEDNDVRNCVHCHNVQEGMNRLLEKDRNYHPDMVASKFPLPEQAGLRIVPDDGVLLEGVVPRSPADRAGLEAGDRLVSLNGQPLISVADITWALGAVADPGQADLAYERAGRITTVKLELEKGWKPADLLWRTSIYQMRPFLQLWVAEVPAARRKELGLGAGDLALVVKGAHSPVLQRAGLKRDDVIVQVGELKGDMRPDEFHLHIRLNYFERGARIPLVLRRGAETIEIELKP